MSTNKEGTEKDITQEIVDPDLEKEEEREREREREGSEEGEIKEIKETNKERR